ncbi:MAG: hypothetical protein AAFY71_18320 [Bacteroidota bacterium]
MKQYIYITLIFSLLSMGMLWAQEEPTEDDYYRITTVPAPEGVHLEAGGVAALPDGAVAVTTRRGDVWIIENPTLVDGEQPRFRLYASGLHEPLGLIYHEGNLIAAQRGELTRLVDSNGDRVADAYETIFAWPLSGHYHEYSFGPAIDSKGNMYVSCNVAFGDEEWWRGESRVPWRGWTLKIDAEGNMEPWATGMRSPAGLGIFDDELFYADNQGDWMGSGGIWHVKKGSFTGHPAGLRWASTEGSPVKLTVDQLYAEVDPRQVKKEGQYQKPENIMNEEEPATLYQLKEKFETFQPPAVWLPHGVLGISNSEMIRDESKGAFGPFAGQIFIGDQGQSKIMRVVMEKVKGEWQGVAFDFRTGFQSGVMRLEQDAQGRMWAGETNRGWGSAGIKNSGLEFLTWRGKTPFEMKTVKAKPDGFEIEFTMPIDKKTAKDLDSYSGRSYVYKYHPVYGSPPIQEEAMKFKGVKVAEDGLSVRLVVENMRPYYLHEIFVGGIRSEEGKLPILHKGAYYTLNNIPDGAKLPVGELSTYRSSIALAKERAASAAAAKRARIAKAKAQKAKEAKTALPTYQEVEPLLVKNTCTACHNAKQRVVGPSFAAIAKRGYSNERIVQLIYKPEPKNWPEYATPMAAMPQVPRKEALRIAAWINTLQ